MKLLNRFIILYFYPYENGENSSFVLILSAYLPEVSEPFFEVMPVENLEEEGLDKNPNLELAQWNFLLTTDKFKGDNDISNKLLEGIKSDSKYSLNKHQCLFTACPRSVISDLKNSTRYLFIRLICYS